MFVPDIQDNRIPDTSLKRLNDINFRCLIVHVLKVSISCRKMFRLEMHIGWTPSRRGILFGTLFSNYVFRNVCIADLLCP